MAALWSTLLILSFPLLLVSTPAEPAQATLLGSFAAVLRKQTSLHRKGAVDDLRTGSARALLCPVPRRTIRRIGLLSNPKMEAPSLNPRVNWGSSRHSGRVQALASRLGIRETVTLFA